MNNDSIRVIKTFKSAVYKAIKIEDQIIKGDLIQTLEYKNAANGNKMEEKLYDSDGSLERASRFDSSGNEIERCYYNSDGGESAKMTFKYSAEGNLEETNSYKKGGSLSYKTKYDEFGNKILTIFYNEDGTVSFKQSYNYDSNGNLIEELVLDLDGNISYRWAKIYDHNNKLVESKYFVANDTLFSTSTFEYDKNGRMIEQNEFNAKGEETRKTSRYNSRGEKIEHCLYSKASIRIKYTYIYENYDEADNWTKMIQFLNGEPNEFVEKVINYY